MSENRFYFVSSEVSFSEISFSESKEKGAFIEATVLELEKASEGPMHNVYQIEEGEEIAKSLIGQPVYYGVNPVGKHDNPFVSGKEKEPVGIVEKARVVGNKIKAIVKIISASLIETLKLGTKYLFSVGGVAISESIKKIGAKLVHVLHGARCNHLQIVDANVPVGFPNAKMERLIEINETVMMCEGDSCKCVNVERESNSTLEISVVAGDVIEE
jgi:LEA14-like dessication related protein